MPIEINDTLLYTVTETDQRVFAGTLEAVDRAQYEINGRIIPIEEKIDAISFLPNNIKDIIRQYLLEIIAEAKVSHDLSVAEITLEDLENVLNGTYQYQ